MADVIIAAVSQRTPLEASRKSPFAEPNAVAVYPALPIPTYASVRAHNTTVDGTAVRHSSIDEPTVEFPGIRYVTAVRRLFKRTDIRCDIPSVTRIGVDPPVDRRHSSVNVVGIGSAPSVVGSLGLTGVCRIVQLS